MRNSMMRASKVKERQQGGATLFIFGSALVLIYFAVFTFQAAAGTPNTKELDERIAGVAALGDLIDYAYQSNPTIVEVREAWRATVESYRVSTGMPDPELMMTYFPEPIETRLGPQDWNATLSQKIPFPGKLIKAGEIVSDEARIAKLQLDKTVRDIVVDIRESFYELGYTRKAKQVAEQNLKLLEHLRKVAETAYAKDRSTLLDVVKAQSQTGQLRYDLLLLEDLEKTEIVRLNGLLNRQPDEPIGQLQMNALPSIAINLESIYALAESNQEEIRIAAVRVEKAKKKIQLARYENMPDFKVGLFYAGIGDPDVANPPSDSGRDALGVQAGLTIPLWFGKNRGRIERSLAEMKKAEAAKGARINDTRTRIRSLYFRVENARRLMDLYRNDLLPQAAKSMAMAETWFRQGQSPFSDFVEAQSVWYNFQLALARATADYGKYLARLERLVGQSITRKESPHLGDAENKEEK